MQIEHLDPLTLMKISESFLKTTQYALVQVLDIRESHAAKLIQELRAKFQNAPRQEQLLLLHQDPVALACNLVEKKMAQIDGTKLRNFNESRRSFLESEWLGVL